MSTETENFFTVTIAEMGFLKRCYETVPEKISSLVIGKTMLASLQQPTTYAVTEVTMTIHVVKGVIG